MKHNIFSSNNKSITAMSISLFVIVIGLTSCTSNNHYRTNANLCSTSTPNTECTTNSIQRYINAENSDENYLIGFVEFDDQGQYHDRNQSKKLLDTLYADAYKNNLLIVVFVHGWQHNAEQNNDYIVNFRQTLKQLSQLESNAAKLEGRNQRDVAGIFVGWRGKSLSIPFVNALTFWDRKATAHKVGNGAVVELLIRLEELRDIKWIVDESKHQSMTRLVIIGHSFGGAIVYTALSQIFKERFIQTKGPVGVTSDVRGFGDLTVLVNPALEAMRFSSLSDMANDRGFYSADQVPVLAVLTSESDLATKYAFPGGRFFSTLFENHREVTRLNKATKQEQIISQSSANRTAIGHFQNYRTHRLMPKERSANEGEMDEIKVYQAVQNQWQADQPGSQIDFTGSVLVHENNSVARNPYLIVKVDEDIIPNHSDIFDPRVAEFIRHFIMLSAHDQKSDFIN